MRSVITSLVMPLKALLAPLLTDITSWSVEMEIPALTPSVIASMAAIWLVANVRLFISFTVVPVPTAPV